ncbi:putative beta-lactamase/transpeptidase-like protein [Tanacetum coccineum]
MQNFNIKLYNIFCTLAHGSPNHILNHTSGLHNALAGVSEEDRTLYCDFDECLKRIAMVAPETEPGREQLYHYLSYGWLCGGIIEVPLHAHYSDKIFFIFPMMSCIYVRMLTINEAFVCPLNLEGELYIGIPPGVESRLATLTIDTNDLITLGQLAEAYRQDPASTATPSSFTYNMIATLIPLCNTLNARRAIQLAVNGHFSARAVARYYAALML